MVSSDDKIALAEPSAGKDVGLGLLIRVLDRNFLQYIHL
jgi:hypothetical protein